MEQLPSSASESYWMVESRKKWEQFESFITAEIGMLREQHGLRYEITDLLDTGNARVDAGHVRLRAALKSKKNNQGQSWEQLEIETQLLFRIEQIQVTSKSFYYLGGAYSKAKGNEIQVEHFSQRMWHGGECPTYWEGWRRSIERVSIARDPDTARSTLGKPIGHHRVLHAPEIPVDDSLAPSEVVTPWEHPDLLPPSMS